MKKSWKHDLSICGAGADSAVCAEASGFQCPKFAGWLRKSFLRDTFDDSYNGSFFSLSFFVRKFENWQRRRKKYVKPFFFLPFLIFPRLTFQLQKRKEREEQLEDVIQAYEKIHMEKSNLQRDLDKMVRDIIQFVALCVRSLTAALRSSHMAH